ncbi:MAG: glycosyltransferase family 39 protein, partial [Deltaproteobacteria bacterium]|nr:glycosyltransferase family 39 protein [Deltaproteobacteria bacterium]
MKKEQTEQQRDITYIAAGIILLLIILFPNGPFGFLPPNISVFMAFLISYGWFRHFFISFDERLKKRERLAEILSLLFFFFFWFLIKVFCIHFSTTDENIYFYMAKRFSEGLMPYRDFFFAHPPVHLIIPAIVFKILGFSVVTAKLIPITASLISGVFLYRTLRLVSGVITGFAGLIYYMFSYQVLMASSDMT